MNELHSSFQKYFLTETALEAAKPLSPKATIGLEIRSGNKFEFLIFSRKNGTNNVEVGTQPSGDIRFILSRKAAIEILEFNLGPIKIKGSATEIEFGDTSEPSSNIPKRTIGQIGVHIAKRIASADPEVKIKMEVHASLLTLMTSGYLSILKAGGNEMAQYLKSKGLDGLSAFKAVVATLKKN